MTLFRLTLKPGEPIFDQVVYAAIKAIISGELPAGTPFPSVRGLAADLKIHPNTAHKVIQHLIQKGLLRVSPGLGTVIAERPLARAEDRRRLLHHEVEQLVVEAKRVGLDLGELVEAIEDHWRLLEKPTETYRK